MNYLLVFVGGGVGSACRYGIAVLLRNYNAAFPVATLLANAMSCIILGVLVGLSLKGGIGDHYKLVFMTGFCGGFSTFSTFSYETLHLIQSGDFSNAITNVVSSVVLCLVCLYLGFKLVV